MGIADRSTAAIKISQARKIKEHITPCELVRLRIGVTLIGIKCEGKFPRVVFFRS